MKKRDIVCEVPAAIVADEALAGIGGGILPVPVDQLADYYGWPDLEHPTGPADGKRAAPRTEI